MLWSMMRRERNDGRNEYRNAKHSESIAMIVDTSGAEMSVVGGV